MKSKLKSKINYQKSGVSIDRADKLIATIKKGKQNKDKNVLSQIGGFSSLYKIDKNIDDPVIVSGTDGVGTKLKIAKILKNHRYIGQDLVAMCVNDVITSGAKPLFFLDYLANSQIFNKLHSTVLNSIMMACKKSNMCLIGGETAEMPGMYHNNDYDLAGFCVGIVSRKKILTPKKIRNGNIILGISSSGFHSNGYSLINKLIDEKRLKLNKLFNGKTIGSIIIKPTKLYVQIIDLLLRKININGLAHITGGGITENLPRIIPSGHAACIELNKLKIPSIFNYIQEQANISDEEMLKTFNCGIGMIAVINKDSLDKAHKIFKTNRCPYKIIGHIIKSPSPKKIIYVD
ncbi:MAG: phosphoribosylformylglycinamidine cyclo-ligase [Gammaproteobacteria bacterium]